MKELDSRKKVTTGNVLKWFMCSYHHTPWSYGLIQSSSCSSYCHCPYFRNDGIWLGGMHQFTGILKECHDLGGSKTQIWAPEKAQRIKVLVMQAQQPDPLSSSKDGRGSPTLESCPLTSIHMGTMVHACPHIQACVFMPPTPIVTMMINLKCCKSHRFTFFPHYWRL